MNLLRLGPWLETADQVQVTAEGAMTSQGPRLTICLALILSMSVSNCACVCVRERERLKRCLQSLYTYQCAHPITDPKSSSRAQRYDFVTVCSKKCWSEEKTPHIEMTTVSPFWKLTIHQWHTHTKKNPVVGQLDSIAPNESGCGVTLERRRHQNHRRSKHQLLWSTATPRPARRQQRLNGQPNQRLSQQKAARGSTAVTLLSPRSLLFHQELHSALVLIHFNYTHLSF